MDRRQTRQKRSALLPRSLREPLTAGSQEQAFPSRTKRRKDIDLILGVMDVLSDTLKDLTEAGVVVSSISPLNSPTWSLKNSGESSGMAMSYPKLKQTAGSIAGARCGVYAAGNWHSLGCSLWLLIWKRRLFSIPVWKEDQKQVPCTKGGQHDRCTVLPQGCVNSLVNGRSMAHLDILQSITLAHNADAV